MPLFRLFIALERPTDAIKTVEIIIDEERKAKEYKKLLQIVAEVIVFLILHNCEVPNKFLLTFNMLLSYDLVKFYAKEGNHLQAARLLLRLVPNFCYLFPSHAYKLTLSAIIESQKCGLHESAYKCAKHLWNDNIMMRELEGTKFCKKVQKIIRHPKQNEIKEEFTTCPLTTQKISMMSIKSADGHLLPICIASGRALNILDEVCKCPISGFLAFYKSYISLLRNQSLEENTGTSSSEKNIVKGKDPIFCKPVSSDDLIKVFITKLYY